jgi:quercetin dioxygenase-like cupin family protein
MPKVVRFQPRAEGLSNTVKFEGADHGTPISFFAIDYAPGQSVGLHVHPYPETWIVRSGRARFTVDGEVIEAGPGDTVVAEAGKAHGFRNIGDTRLDVVCIHASGRIVQEFTGAEAA